MSNYSNPTIGQSKLFELCLVQDHLYVGVSDLQFGFKSVVDAGLHIMRTC